MTVSGRADRAAVEATPPVARSDDERFQRPRAPDTRRIDKSTTAERPGGPTRPGRGRECPVRVGKAPKDRSREGRTGGVSGVATIPGRAGGAQADVVASESDWGWRDKSTEFRLPAFDPLATFAADGSSSVRLDPQQQLADPKPQPGKCVHRKKQRC